MLNTPADNDNSDTNITPEQGAVMRIFIFKSEASPDLRAFGSEMDGSRLPKQFSPWRAVGAIAPDQNPPHNLSRDVIETAIKAQGFQLWRMSKKD
jgi:hypothetical protein